MGSEQIVRIRQQLVINQLANTCPLVKRHKTLSLYSLERDMSKSYTECPSKIARKS